MFAANFTQIERNLSPTIIFWSNLQRLVVGIQVSLLAGSRPARRDTWLGGVGALSPRPSHAKMDWALYCRLALLSQGNKIKVKMKLLFQFLIKFYLCLYFGTLGLTILFLFYYACANNLLLILALMGQWSYFYFLFYNFGTRRPTQLFFYFFGTHGPP